jgi:DNA-binding NarL/FixJ family response regulator
MKNKIKLLIVDDSDFLRKLTVAVLSDDIEIEVVGECTDGDEVCGFLESNYVDVILMDIQMKRMNGDEATLLITQKYPDVKIIAYTTVIDNNERNHLINCGIKGYISKSTELFKVSQVIKSVHHFT